MCTNQTLHWMENANDLFTVFCGVTSVISNALVLYIALRYVDFHAKLNQIYVVNMTVSDLVYGLVYMSTKPFIACFPYWVCACYYILVWSCSIGSVFFLLFLNIDKFISLSAPLHYHMYVTETRVRWLWILFWPIPVAHSLVTYFGPWLIPSTIPGVPCRIGVHPIYYASTIIVFYIVPLTISALISVYIYLLAHKKTRCTPQASQCQTVERKRARKQLLKRVFFVFSSTLWSTITILPYRLVYSIYTFACFSVGPDRSPIEIETDVDFSSNFSISVDAFSTLAPSSTYNQTLINDVDAGGWSMCSSEEISVLIYVFFCLPPLGAVGNPIITIVTQRFYRTRAARIWASCLAFFHAPNCFLCKSVGRRALEDIDTSITYDHDLSVRRTAAAAKTNGTEVPLLVTSQKAREEALCANRAFQVL